MPVAAAAAGAFFASAAAAVTAVTSTVVLGLTVGTWLTVGATALSLGMAMSAAAEAKKAAKGLESTGQQLQLKAAGDSAPVPFMLGRTATGGYLVYRDTYGAKNAELAMVTVLSGGGPIEGIESYSAGDYGIGFATNPNTGLASVTGTSPSSDLYAGKMRQRWLNGSPTDGSPSDYSGIALPGIGTADKLPGLAHVLMLSTYDTKRYPSGLPSKNLWVGSGLKHYDPRKDSTYPGGSGPHRWGQPATYTWSENPGVVALNWSLGIWDNGKRVGGIGADLDQLDLPAFVEMANVCDANRWAVGGVVTSDDNKFSVLNAILQAGGAVAAARGAQLSVIQKAPKASIYSIGIDDVVGTVEINNTTGQRDRKNGILPVSREETSGWEMRAGQLVTSPTYLAEDNGEIRNVEIQYALVQQSAQAHQLAAYDLVDTREFLTATIVCKPRLLNVRVGDCVTVQLPDIAANDVKMLVVGRTLDPASLQVTLSLRAETDAKHPFALGQSQTAPPSPSLGGFDPAKPPIPANAAWWVSAGTVNSPSGVKEPAIFLDGSTENDPYASAVIVELQRVGDTAWTPYGEFPPTTTHIEITGVSANVQYRVAVSYRSVRDVVREEDVFKLILGPVIPGDHVIPWTGNTIVDRPPSLTDLINGYLQAKYVYFEGKVIPEILADYANTVAEFANNVAQLEQAVANASLTGAAKQDELDKLAWATMSNVLDDEAERLAALRRDHIDGQSIGSIVVSEIVRTDDLVETIDLIGVKSDDGTAFVFDSDKVQVANGVSLAEKFSAIEANTATANAFATQQLTALANTVAAESNARTSLASTVANNAAAANQQLSTLANTTTAQGQFLSTLGALTPNGNAIVLDASKVQVSPGVSLASRDSLVDAKFSGNSASGLLTTAQAAATTANAAVSTLQQMGATIGNGGAYAIDSTRVITNNGQNLATRLTNLSSDIGSKTTTADVNSLITASTGTGQSLASSLTSVTTTANGANATAQLALSSSNGNGAQAALTLGVNGRVSGFKINGINQTFEIIASRFSIVDNSGATPIVPFVYSGGEVWMESAIAKRLAAGTIVAGHINAAQIVTDHLVDNSVTVPTITSASWGISGAGMGSPQVILSQYVPLTRAGQVSATATIAQHFPNGNRQWGFNLYINGSLVYRCYGANGQDSIALAGALYCPAGNIPVEVHWFAQDGTVNIDYRSLTCSGNMR